MKLTSSNEARPAPSIKGRLRSNCVCVIRRKRPLLGVTIRADSADCTENGARRALVRRLRRVRYRSRASCQVGTVIALSVRAHLPASNPRHYQGIVAAQAATRGLELMCGQSSIDVGAISEPAEGSGIVIEDLVFELRYYEAPGEDGTLPEGEAAEADDGSSSTADDQR